MKTPDTAAALAAKAANAVSGSLVLTADVPIR